ncbi:family 78 glycoside hydrolase catalytic domain [Actinacidiphila acidipaludis]|uniref:alpha-L-rhamnosidase n=1 Tax=Actinacidiphila acidipaludis TaxID=2873382 RepID=A0ABS7QFR1_9ACTN|nr:family 78 glycoside hydrolase catalytic domain [Streptomyces acidipaludis]MBY8882008.1 family 78 glycoside hydrolase catalytic domain [Streptomyces acidipaludis]
MAAVVAGVAAGAALAAMAPAVPAAASAAAPRLDAASAGPLAPAGLRVDGHGAGLPAGESRPLLSWTARDTGRAEAQTAYEIRLGPAPGPARARDQAATWDSGRTSSAQSTGVPYGGPRLSSDHSYTWSVRTWNSQGRPSRWSAPATFDTGLLDPADWSAWWIQADDGALARGDVDITKPVARARLYFAAQGLAEPHLNGAVVDPTEVLDSSVTDYAARALYRDMDVTTLLRHGRNALGFMIGKGQASGRPAFVAQLDVTYTDGTHDAFGTGPDWRTTPGPVTGDDFYYGETYDARRAVPGWDTADAEVTDDSAWTDARAIAPASHPLSLAQGRPVTAHDTTSCCGWSPAALTDGVDGSSDASEGYHSAIESSADSTKWVQTDLGADRAVRQIALFPARPTNDPAGDFKGAGFPVRYKVEVSDDPSFATATTVADRTDSDQPQPGTDPVRLPADATGRYVRVTATELRCIGASCTFRLAELGVYGAQPVTGYSAITRLEADTAPPTRVVRTLTPVRQTRPGNGSRVYDFGQDVTGWVTVSATQPAGTTVDIKKGEILDAAGHVTTANISFSAADPPRQTDHYTFAGTGTESYAPHFNYSGFRYAELTGLPDDADVTVTAQVVHTDVATTGTFSTSNPLLDSIQDAVARTQLNDLQSIPLDCPTREKHGWLGDAGDSDVEAMANYDMQSFYTKWLGDVVTSLNPDGSIPSVAPANGGQNSWRTDPAWGSAYPQIVWDAYQAYGSTSPITANYAQVKAWVDYLGTISDADHIVVDAPTSWGDDWVASVSTPHDYFQTGFFYLDAQLLSKMARVVGDTADATHYSALADQIAAGLTKRYFDAGTGVYANGTQLAYAMPLMLGIVPAGHEQATVDRLVQDIAAHDDHLTTGFVGSTMVFQALGAHGRNDVALAVAERTDFPSLGYMVRQGPGTIWEKWPDSAAPDGTSSKDHIGLGGSIGQWFYQQLAGIQPGSGTGNTALTLAPSVVGDLTSASGQQETAHGTVVSAWQRDGSTLTYHAVVPVGATATVRLPLLGGAGSVVRESGRTVYAAGGTAQQDPGLTVGAATSDTVTLTAGSGDYTFTVLPPAQPFTRLSVTAAQAAAAPIIPGGSGDLTAVVEGRSTGTGTATVGANVPAGWTATAEPAGIPLTPATTETRATVHLTVPDGTPSGVYPVTLTVRAPDGTHAATTVDVPVFGRWAAGTTATASSAHAPNVVDGATRTYDAANAIDGNLGTFWNDDTQGRYPDTLTVTAPDAVPLHGVGFASFSDGVPVDFTVQTWDGTGWVTQATVTGNSAVHRWIPFSSPVTTTQVRLTVTATQDGFTRVAELTP